MTELNLIYGANDQGSMNNEYLMKSNDKKDMSYQNLLKEEAQASRISGQQIYQMASQESPKVQQNVQVTPVQVAQQPVVAPQPLYATSPPQYMVQPRQKKTEYSFFDRMSLKKDEVIKLAIFSLVIVLGIAMDRIGTHYISKYLDENVLTDMQEFLLRLSYPVVIFLVLWMMKSL